MQSRYAGLDGAGLLAPLIREEFPGRIALVSSFGIESAILLHMVAAIDSATPVIFLDTGKLFAQTQSYKEMLVHRLGLRNVVTARPDARVLSQSDPEGQLNKSDPESCCDVRKIQPLENALTPYQAWITGRKRYQGGERKSLALVESFDGRIKVNPLALWAPEQIEEYFVRHDLPRHPLWEQGYTSVGCEPCTQKTSGACGVRDGRWAGTGKTECGIHLDRDGRLKRVA